MVNNMARRWWLGGWVTVLALVLAICTVMTASLSTTMFLMVLGIAPGIVIALLKDQVASPTVAEILHAVEKDGRP
jgi:hypothetical protein